MKREVEVVLFGLEQDGDLRREYQELADIPEFQDLKVKEVRFCWLVGNRTSPIFGIKNKTDRVHKALAVTYGSNYTKREDLRAIANGEFPDELLAGIKKMSTFNPEFRLKAKLMDQYIFETLNEIVVVSEAEKLAMDIDEKKKYADLAIKVSSELKGIVDRLENGYGIKTIDKKTKKKVLVNINQVTR